MIEFQHWLQRLLEEKSKGMDTSSQEYLHLCLTAWVCLRVSSDARRRFIGMVEKRRGKSSAKSLENDARRFWNEAQELRKSKDQDLHKVQGCG